MQNVKQVHMASAPKTDKWKSASELSKLVVTAEKCIVSDCMKEFQGHMPDAFQYRNSGRVSVFCLNIDYLDKFLEYSDLHLNNRGLPAKPQDWKTAKELTSEYISSASPRVVNLLKKLQPEMPEAISYFRSGNFSPICLHINSLDKFCELSGLPRKSTCSQKKKEGWKSAGELSRKIITAAPQRIHIFMEKFQPEMPEAIQSMLSHGRVILCLNMQYIEKFCEVAELKYNKRWIIREQEKEMRRLRNFWYDPWPNER